MKLKQKIFNLKHQPLTSETIAVGIQELSERDSDLAKIIVEYGHPPNWEREEGFPGLVRIIVGQQVSVASANAISKRLINLVQPLTPENFLKFDDMQLQKVGLSRQKITYCRALSQAISNGEIDLDFLASAEEETIRTQLKSIKGIGDWTVDIYLMMSLQRADAFPKGDLGLIIAYQKLKNLPSRPTPKELEYIAEKWRPWRAIATRILWHYYLSIG